jgi:hypothetical protein
MAKKELFLTQREKPQHALKTKIRSFIDFNLKTFCFTMRVFTADAEVSMAPRMGKPWATVSYHKSMSNNMVMNMVRGFTIDLVAAFLLIWLLLKIPGLNMMTAVQASIGVGLISYLTIPYLNSIWFEGNSMEHLIDAIGQWGLVGLWLGWWLPRK